MGTSGEDRRIDDKGRVTIPRRIRERLNLEPGETVSVDADDGRVVIRPRVSRETFVESMEGCITEATKRDDAPSPAPADLKGDWTADLPGGE